MWISIVPYQPYKYSNITEDIMFWDYHVVSVVREKEGCHRWGVIDFDLKTGNIPKI